MNNNEIKKHLRGNIVPVPAQFHDDLSINLPAVEQHIEFLLSKGVKNFYLAMSASEFEYMSKDERVSIAECIAKKLPSDAILLAQALGPNCFEEQLTEAKIMADLGADAIVIAPRGIKEGGKFFSSVYKRGHYSPEAHDDYFVDYMERMASQINAPLVYHDKPFANGRGSSMDMLIRITDIDNIISVKEHVSDPGVLRKIYRELGEKIVFFDGFGKTVQFWSLQWGAKARHTCWSWFDPESDSKFMNYIESGNLNEAARIVNNEWPIAEAIAETGFQGYKYIMELMGLPSSPVRIPGEKISEKQKEMIKHAVIQIRLFD